MGLDVSLHRCALDLKKVKARKDECSEKIDLLRTEFLRKAGVTKKYELPVGLKAELDAQESDIAEEYGVDKYGNSLEDLWGDAISMESSIHTDHPFQIGYWRSSYNSSGFNRVVSSLIGKDLYYIIEESSVIEESISGDKYHLTLDWNKALERAKELRDALREAVEGLGSVGIMTINYNPFKDPEHDKIASENDALEVFKEERKRETSFSSYSNHNGIFTFQEPIKVYAFIEGVDGRWKNTQPVTYVVYERGDDENETGYGWYLAAADIVVETLEWVLAQVDHERYVLAWNS